VISKTSDGFVFTDFGRVPRNAVCPCGSGKKAKKCHEEYTRSPLPGLDGTFEGSCLLCLRGTTEAVAFWGEIDMYYGALRKGGMSWDEIFATEEAAANDGIDSPRLGLNGCRMCLFCQRKLGLPEPKEARRPGEPIIYVQPVETMKLESQLAIAQARVRLEQGDTEVTRCAACDKTSFKTERAAAKRLNALWLNVSPNGPDPPHRAYLCPKGNGWHLTRKRLGT
jgi:hypothetical protein